MSKKTKMIPYRRFKQFLDAPAWEQRELGDLGNTYSGLSGKSKSDFGHGDAQYITYMNVFSNTIIDHESTEPIEIDFKQNLIQVGDVFFTTSSEVPEEVGMSSVLVKPMPFTYLNSFCFGFRPHIKLDHYYLAYLLRSHTVRNQLTQQAQGISRYNLSSKKVMKTALSFPSSDEEKKIGKLFYTLDQFITLHQRKLDKLKETKKAYLNQMFPAEGKRKPHIRFAGFTDDWEQRELGEIAYKVTEKNNHLSLRETFTNSAEFGIVSQTDYFDHSISRLSRLQNYYVVKPLDFVYNPRISVTAPVGPINLNKTDRVGVMSPLYTVFRTEKTNHIFLEYYFKSKVWHHFMRSNGDSGARSDRFSIKDAIFFKMEVSLPILAEQCDIADFLYVYDHLITLHQRKLQKLKDLKKAYLNEMFV